MFKYSPVVYFVACTGELGIAYWKIENEAMAASSHSGPGYEPWMARLGNPLGAWCASVNNLNQYLRVDLGQTYRLGHMAVEGANGTEQWVKSFTLSFSADTEGEQETPYTEDGSVKVYMHLVLFCLDKPSFDQSTLLGDVELLFGNSVANASHDIKESQS